MFTIVVALLRATGRITTMIAFRLMRHPPVQMCMLKPGEIPKQ
jgi:hypothetical protein